MTIMKNDDQIIKLLDYLIAESACDLCGKCVNYISPKRGEDYTPCTAFEKEGNLACRNGMIEWFRNNE